MLLQGAYREGSADLDRLAGVTGSIPVGGTKFKAAKVHNLPAFFFFPSADFN
ncbi:hypothetical protein O987_24030 [Comamonas testosteroni TK102]|uniref:Uncharacterized protein n=1 Tax=Comamonas testosteroni TK102 TaxID=1392005 RepID=A0A076PT39_COMTE|nr:hypothetical protein O987_24030 [Comamonas testosteroni TK102]